MRIRRSLCVAGVLFAAAGISRADTIPYSGAITTYTVPTTGIYDIIAVGGSGGGTRGSAMFGGLGGVVEGHFSLSAGDVLTILVGGKGDNGLGAAGGGGGTFVVDFGNNPLLIAGGGGGSARGAGQAATGIATSGGGGGTGGAATVSGGGGGGGGLNTDGTAGADDSAHVNPGGTGGASFSDGGAGGLAGGSHGANGGFGGGGGGGEDGGGGGGGGYTGGDGGAGFDAGVPNPGLGGSSYNADPLGTFSLDTTHENGSVSITLEHATAVPLPASAPAGAVLFAIACLVKLRDRLKAAWR